MGGYPLLRTRVVRSLSLVVCFEVVVFHLFSKEKKKKLKLSALLEVNSNL